MGCMSIMWSLYSIAHPYFNGIWHGNFQIDMTTPPPKEEEEEDVTMKVR